MTQDLGLSAAQFGLASGIFFIGYILLEVPSNLALHRFGARKWLARIMVSLGHCLAAVRLGEQRRGALSQPVGPGAPSQQNSFPLYIWRSR